MNLFDLYRRPIGDDNSGPAQFVMRAPLWAIGAALNLQYPAMRRIETSNAPIQLGTVRLPHETESRFTYTAFTVDEADHGFIAAAA